MYNTRILAVASIVFLMLAGRIQANDDDSSNALQDVVDHKSCVHLASIRNTDVIDDWNIIFYMRGPEIYRNRLPRRCPGLRAADRFSYRTSLNVLCNVDIIRPLRNIGGGFSPGAGCGLGMFEPITKEEIALLRDRPVEVDTEAVEPEIEPLE